MTYNEVLRKRVKNQLSKVLSKEMTEKKMLDELVFIIEEKMGINVSGEKLMCRFHPALKEEVKLRKAYLPMTTKGKIHKGYCNVEKIGFKSNTDF